ncbi:uncharacterized protein LOC109802917 [Cajanus cajan]|uniref:Late embryogenesis abundant protein LEA-2 subgroup domain-containing protein n=1 Tax=Cajanus cajan TaxID=3821 RepID=A0A151TBA3_CAJCA|nr:uncharacterized protein LOC109802917 [Cajanus cajan]KYP64328.1 hypothetical protein KK1_018921 [Cajanus cajan]
MSNHNGMHHNNVVEDHEALMFQTYPCAYYVQSPSTLSHANSADIRSNIQNDAESTFQSPNRSETHPLNPTHEEDEASRFALCRYSSSRGSSHSFLHHKKISYDGSHATVTENGDVNHMVIVDSNGSRHVGDEKEDEEEGLFYEYYYGKGNGGWKRYFTYRNSDSLAWIWLQMSWRILLSFGIALLVFYIATKPPPPNVSVEIARFPEFKLAEGVDRTGVTTKILTCNCSLNLIIENKSRFFGLHIRPPTMDMKFSNLPFAFSNGNELYAESGLTIFALQMGAKNKPMYGAGRSMQDMLDSGRGLPLVVRVMLSSSFEVVPRLVKPRFHHHVECVVVLKKAYDKKHRSQAFDSTCKLK